MGDSPAANDLAAAVDRLKAGRLDEAVAGRARRLRLCPRAKLMPTSVLAWSARILGRRAEHLG